VPIMLSLALSRKPKKYSEKVVVEFIETMYFRGYTRTADKLFTNETTELPPLIYHAFNYDYRGVKYEFKLRDDKEKEKFDVASKYEAYVNPDEPISCWFQKMELNGYLWEPDKEDDY